MIKQPSKIHRIHHLLHRHRLRVAAVIITLLGLIGLFIISLIYFPSNEYSEEPSTPISEPEFVSSHDITAQATTTPEAEKPSPIVAPTEAPLQPVLTRVTVREGESLSSIFKRLHISQNQLIEIIKLPGVQTQIHALRKGQILEFSIDTQQQLQTLIMPISKTNKLVVTRTPTGFTETTTQEKTVITTEIAKMTIHSSFYGDGEKANIPLSLLNNFMNIFKWNVDFHHNLHEGDSIAILYELVRNQNTNKTEIGNILAAAYTHKNKILYAIRYHDANGQSTYYDQNGNSLRKAFRRKPIDTGYVSSPFNLHRLHPILGYVRPHLGTDFAAPYGTPIHATGDGRIILRGRKGGYGRCIMINHGNGIVTLYGHMSRFATQFKRGSYVKMGQIIGYIGTSGLADGPHVHYEFRVNKQFKNPMTVILPNGISIPAKKRLAFLAYAKHEISLIHSENAQQVTSN